jgi:hypothetical protein
MEDNIWFVTAAIIVLVVGGFGFYHYFSKKPAPIAEQTVIANNDTVIVEEKPEVVSEDFNLTTDEVEYFCKNVCKINYRASKTYDSGFFECLCANNMNYFEMNGTQISSAEAYRRGAAFYDNSK